MRSRQMPWKLVMNLRRALILMTATLLVSPVVRSGHEQSVYPSYYPHEIEIAAMAPPRAAELMRAGKLHAYVGGVPQFDSPPPDRVGTVESLGSFVIVRLNPDSPITKDGASACAAGAGIVRDAGERGGGLIVHPYPVTPLHGDYLEHADRAEGARQRLLAAPSRPGDLKVRAAGNLARSLVRPEWLTEGTQWDAAIEEVSASALVAESMVALNGWLGPRWVRTGWYQAYRLLRTSMTGTVLKQELDSLVERLQTTAYEGTAERINLERELVRLLLSGCRAMVAGYTVRREYFNAEFSAGIENLSFDALEGFASPMFLRTVKLKDFPWNGWLQLGLEGRPVSAWNPIGGFTDDFGRLMWFAVGDAAAIPSPYDATWTLNRISEVEVSPKR
jgi:hypothetical protein